MKPPRVHHWAALAGALVLAVAALASAQEPAAPSTGGGEPRAASEPSAAAGAVNYAQNPPKLKSFAIEPGEIYDGKTAKAVVLFDRTGQAEMEIRVSDPYLARTPRFASLGLSTTRVEFSVEALAVNETRVVEVLVRTRDGQELAAPLTIKPSRFFEYKITGDEAWSYAKEGGFHFAPFGPSDYYTAEPRDGFYTIARLRGVRFGYAISEDAAIVDRGKMVVVDGGSRDEWIDFHMFYGADKNKPLKLASGWKVKEIVFDRPRDSRFKKTWKANSDEPHFVLRIKRENQGRDRPPQVARIVSMTLTGPKDAHPSEAFAVQGRR